MPIKEALSAITNHIGQQFIFGDAELKVIEKATGFFSGRWAKEDGYWVRVTRGNYKGFMKGEELLMSQREINKNTRG
ncbi:MAG: hypothetical protein HZA11_09255 [Nitrospirae bacterium]|nr:hypothetical protein [Nitrospirota bacterium]